MARCSNEMSWNATDTLAVQSTFDPVWSAVLTQTHSQQSPCSTALTFMRTPDYPNPDVPKWAAVDAYFADRLAPSDESSHQVLAAAERAGMPRHEVSAVQGKFLALLVKLTGARRILEIGTLGGFSTIWMARALPENARITTIERNPDYARVAQENFSIASVDEKVDLRVGAAVDVLPTLTGPFDLVFIDADKPNNPIYLEWAIRLARAGTVILGDNVVRGGEVVNPESTDPNVIGVRKFMDMLATDPRLDSTALQTVGEKGWDGFSLTVVKGV